MAIENREDAIAELERVLDGHKQYSKRFEDAFFKILDAQTVGELGEAISDMGIVASRLVENEFGTNGYYDTQDAVEIMMGVSNYYDLPEELRDPISALYNIHNYGKDLSYDFRKVDNKQSFFDGILDVHELKRLDSFIPLMKKLPSVINGVIEQDN